MTWFIFINTTIEILIFKDLLEHVTHWQRQALHQDAFLMSEEKARLPTQQSAYLLDGLTHTEYDGA
jgi:hypothetical protein